MPTPLSRCDDITSQAPPNMFHYQLTSGDPEHLAKSQHFYICHCERHRGKIFQSGGNFQRISFALEIFPSFIVSTVQEVLVTFPQWGIDGKNLEGFHYPLHYAKLQKKKVFFLNKLWMYLPAEG